MSPQQVSVHRARLTESYLRFAYLTDKVSIETAEEAMVLGRTLWSRDLYPRRVIADVIYRANRA